MFAAPTLAIIPSTRVVRVHVFRHGEVETGGRRVCRGQSDVPLSDRGRAQCDAAAAAFRSRHGQPDQVISSDLSRCVWFAERFGVPVRYVPALREQDMGRWEGHDWEELSAADGPAVTAYWEDYVHGRPTGGETWGEASARIVGWWEQEREAMLDQRVVIIGHVGTVRALLCSWMGLGPDQALRWAPGFATHTQVLWAEAGAVIERMGETLS